MAIIVSCAKRGLAVSVLLVSWIASPGWAAPETFREAKKELRTHVYHDQHQNGHWGTLYCGCDWRWVGESGGRVDHRSCGYQIRKQPNRAARTEWEHIVPASSMGRARQCWQEGGRKHCRATDPVFSRMEADLYNLTPAIGEVNADRSNYRFAEITGIEYRHGACDFKVDFKGRKAAPRDRVKGFIARTYFYVHDHYDLPMSAAQERLLMQWDRQFPVTEWERERHRRIARIMGHPNPFVTGARQWTPGHQNSGAGVRVSLPADHPARQAANDPDGGAIRGNKNSNVYHLPAGCPSYHRIAPHNIIEFESEAEAEAAGFRKAGNCR